MAEKDNAKAKGHRLAWLAKPDVWRISTVKLLIALILLFAATPFVENLPNGDFVESGLVTLVMIAALIAVGRDPRVLISAAVLLVPAIASKWLHVFFPSHVSSLYYPAFGMVFFGFTIYRILRFILQTAHVDLDVLSAGIVVYLMLGMVWAEAYILLAQLNVDAFGFSLADHSESRMNGFNAFYFSFSALTTVGFGDITPLSKVARTLAVMEAVTGTLYLAILISRLVGMYSSTARAALPENSDKP
jgi:Ion channel